MITRHFMRTALVAALATAALIDGAAIAAPSVFRLTPPSELFVSGSPSPIIARFLTGQKFDLQATVIPDTGFSISSVDFVIDGVVVGTAPGAPTTSLVTTGLVSSLTPSPSTNPSTGAAFATPGGTAVASLRGYSNLVGGVHTLSVNVTQTNGSISSTFNAVATGNFEVIGTTPIGRRVKNVIIMLGDGMGAAHRTAARIMQKGITQGKARAPLAMDTFPVTGLVQTASLNSIVTDSAPGMQNYVTGNKSSNNQEGVFPDDTTAAFDNPRIEYMSEFLARNYGKKLGIVTTADVFDATPASMAVHTQARGNGTGIVDQYFDDRALTGLTVLMGGGRKWFLPNPTACPGSSPTDCGSASGFNGSARGSGTDYILPADIINAWGAAGGALDAGRNLIGDFTGAGWSYAPTKTAMLSAPSSSPLLGLFSLSNMNIALDKIGKRRGTSTVVDDYGFPDQPLLEEMTDKALQVLDANSPNGFLLMVEGASIDKQAHNMDSERWIVDTIEFDKAIAVAKQYADTHPDTLVLITADHECSGAAIIGASRVTNASLVTRSTSGAGTGVGGPRNGVVGTYDLAGFPRYVINGDGYPDNTDPDFKMLIGYGADGDRYEDWLTNPRPLRDSQQPGNGSAPLNTYPNLPINRDTAGGFQITGQIEDTIAAHTASDIPLSAAGRGASLFTGVFDNTDVFFKVMQTVIGGAVK